MNKVWQIEVAPDLSREMRILALECHFYRGEYNRTGDKKYLELERKSSRKFLDMGGVIATETWTRY